MANRERYGREQEHSQTGRRREQGEHQSGRRESEYGRESGQGEWGGHGPDTRQSGREWDEREGVRDPYYEDFSERRGYSGQPGEYGGERGGWRQQGGYGSGGYGQRGGAWREQESWGGPWGQEDYGQTGGYGYNRGERRWSGQERSGRSPEYPGEWWGGPSRQSGYVQGGYGEGGHGPGGYGSRRYGPANWAQDELGGFGQSREYGQAMSGTGRGQGMRQSFAGRGPKGYQRSDDRIKEDISEQLTQHPEIDASEIEVRVQNGEVTLTGTVDSRHAKRLAEDITESASGVKECHNQVRVKQHESESSAAGSPHGRSSETSPKAR